MRSNRYLIAGLGNPEAKYEQTRHNVGFMFVDWLADYHGTIFTSTKHQSLTTNIRLGTTRVTLLKPQTFMNRSGRSVASLMHFWDMDPSNLMVVHDDIDMHPGRVKLVEGGGTGGHNGIRSIVADLGTRDFFRLKIGVGRPGTGGIHPDMEVDKYVLAKFSAAELEHIKERFEEMASGLGDFIRGDVSQAMTRLNAIK
ncbi:MAG: aminoacyl-tRNA hydrolase [Desulfofustis sp.]|nr:aminoacyl-tRNA hydrolase [Desulfofustis sp.]NNK14506.1 aminoacyl-tRNA hydrolase [Desulfofustis sp.]